MKGPAAVLLTQGHTEVALLRVFEPCLIIQVIGVQVVVRGTGAPTEVPIAVHVPTNRTEVLPRVAAVIAQVAAVRVHVVVEEAIEVQEAREEVLVAAFEVLVVLPLDVPQVVDDLQVVDVAMVCDIKPIS